jgi:hypothetical protein
MANSIDNLMQDVYALLLAAYRSSTGSSSALLAFEPIGIPISNAMFMLPGTNTVSCNMGIEQVSELANFLPTIINGMIGSSDRTANDFYGLILIVCSAQAGPGSDADSFAIAKARRSSYSNPSSRPWEIRPRRIRRRPATQRQPIPRLRALVRRRALRRLTRLLQPARRRPHRGRPRSLRRAPRELDIFAANRAPAKRTRIGRSTERAMCSKSHRRSRALCYATWTGLL